MRLLYAIGMGFLYSMLWLASLFNAKARKWINGRKKHVTDFPVPEGRSVAWFHCASLGEFDQGLPVMNAYKERFPDAFLLVTFFSPSGMEFYNKRKHQVDLACYLPLDTARNARKFIRHFRPKHVFFVKYEFWYNHLLEAKKSGASVFGVSSLFRPTHRFFKWYGGFFRSALRLFDHFYVQDQRSAHLLASIGIECVTISGDTRYDRMWAVRESNPTNPVLEQFKGDEQLLMLGSSWPVDEALFVPFLEKLTAEFKLVVAPHDIAESHVEEIVSKFGPSVQRYTSFSDPSVRVLVLDTIGQLTAAYRYADVAYIGGGFTGKLHNILEPGAFGLPVIFGPHHERFPEAQLFIDRGVAVSIPDQFALLPVIQSLMNRKMAISEELEQLFLENRGAAALAIKDIR